MKNLAPWLLCMSLICQTHLDVRAVKTYAYAGFLDDLIYLPVIYNITQVMRKSYVAAPIQPLFGIGIQAPGITPIQKGYFGIEVALNFIRAAHNKHDVQQKDLGILGFIVYKNYWSHFYNFSLGSSFKLGFMNDQYLYDKYTPHEKRDTIKKYQDMFENAKKCIEEKGLRKSLENLQYFMYHINQNRNYEIFLEKIHATPVFSGAMSVFIRPLKTLGPWSHVCFEIEAGPLFIMPRPGTSDDSINLLSMISCFVNVKIYFV